MNGMGALGPGFGTLITTMNAQTSQLEPRLRAPRSNPPGVIGHVEHLRIVKLCDKGLERVQAKRMPLGLFPTIRRSDNDNLFSDLLAIENKLRDQLSKVARHRELQGDAVESLAMGFLPNNVGNLERNLLAFFRGSGLKNFHVVFLAEPFKGKTGDDLGGETGFGGFANVRDPALVHVVASG